MKNSRFARSQAAHKRLCNTYSSKGSSDKNRALGNYHAEVYDRQRSAGKVLSRTERKKIFSWWWNYETKHLNR